MSGTGMAIGPRGGSFPTWPLKPPTNRVGGLSVISEGLYDLTREIITVVSVATARPVHFRLRPQLPPPPLLLHHRLLMFHTHRNRNRG